MARLDAISQGPLLQVKKDIESMRTRGAGNIGKEAALALARAAEGFSGSDVGALRALLLDAANLLAAARPTAVTLRNGLNEMLAEAQKGRTVAEVRKNLAAAGAAYVKRVDDGKKEIAKLALKLMRDGDVVLTHCHSTAAGGAIAHAARKLKGVRVFSTETRPFRQGLIQSPALAKEGVDVTLIVDAAVALIMETERVTRVIVGADTIAADGSLYNKVGTRQVAELARRFGIPFIVCAEREKFSPYTLRGDAVPIEERAITEVADPALVPGVKIRNPVFDRTPPDLIEVYVTDQGLVKPGDVRAFIERQFGATQLRI